MNRFALLKIAAAAGCAAGLCAPTVAGDLPPIALVTQLGYLEARPDMFKSPSSDARAASPSGFYAVSGDFDGDGRTDEARILIKKNGHDGMMVAVIDRGYNIKTYGFEKMKSTMIGNIGIKLAPAGTYTLAKPENGATTKTIGRDAIMMFRFGGAARLYTFSGDDFVSTDIVQPG